MRSAIRLVLLVSVLLLISPFVISSLLIDQRGVNVAGRVVSKDEYIRVHYTSWTRSFDVSVRYDPPDRGGVAFMNAQVGPDEFDKLRTGDLVTLHYLRQQDLPDYSVLRTLREIHMLPTVRLADKHTWSGLAEIIDAHVLAITAVLGVALVLTLWRMLGIPGFTWAVAGCVGLAIAISYITDFPRPMPAPQNNVRTAMGTVKSLERCTWLFRGNRQRGFRAEQPIQIVSVQFVPEGRPEPVVAVDLIDDGSVPALREKGSVPVEYDASEPRHAYIRAATRHFPERNLRGLATQGIAVVALFAGVLIVVTTLSKGYRRLIERRST
jgi:hypothetical protein